MRIAGKGLIDRTKPVTFTFDGKAYSGFQGDTLASALMANGVRLVGRSFKYHRPRGILTAGPEEPNAMVEVLDGGSQSPNTRATVQEIYDGMAAQSQNRWPSLRYDILSINDLAAPFLSAGFYYKTFMWPRAFWEALYRGSWALEAADRNRQLREGLRLLRPVGDRLWPRWPDGGADRGTGGGRCDLGRARQPDGRPLAV